MRNKGFGSVGVGLSSVILILTVLCFTVFALLALLSAHNDAELNDRSVDAIGAYYAADAEAQRMIAEIEEKAAEGGSVLSESVFAEGDELYFEVPIDKTRRLSVRLAPNGDGYSVISCKVEALGEWTPAPPRLH